VSAFNEHYAARCDALRLGRDLDDGIGVDRTVWCRGSANRATWLTMTGERRFIPLHSTGMSRYSAPAPPCHHTCHTFIAYAHYCPASSLPALPLPSCLPAERIYRERATFYPIAQRYLLVYAFLEHDVPHRGTRGTGVNRLRPRSTTALTTPHLPSH